jgi:hypothetical protein
MPAARNNRADQSRIRINVASYTNAGNSRRRGRRSHEYSFPPSRSSNSIATKP